MGKWNDHGQLLYTTDEIMFGLQRNLEEDAFRSTGVRLHTQARSVSELRNRTYPSPFCWNDANRFKWQVQIDNLCKRYLFKHEPLGRAEVIANTLAKYLANAKRLNTLVEDEYLLNPLCVKVLSRASEYCSAILGTYDEEEVFRLAKFGSNSTVGNPYAASYLHMKLQDSPLTGTLQQFLVMDRYLETDTLLREITESNPAKGKIVASLKLSLVPKTYKVHRPIVPNTTIGNFITAGQQAVITHRLLDAGLDIRHLQAKHRKLVKSLSVNRTHATADLSSASDSITKQLVEALLPESWYEALLVHHIPNVYVSEDAAGKPFTVNVPTFAGMGIGYTFPLETLVFYSILEAIRDLAGVHEGFCSVYGDDLIYPRRLHRYVATIFPMLGFILNMEKTYAEEYFRESCGADFYRGVDVRPFQPMAEHRTVDWRGASSFIYKLVNGLRAHWEDYEISTSINYLLSWLRQLTAKIHVVPPSMPESAGIRSCKPYIQSFSDTYAKPKYVRYQDTAVTKKWGYRYALITEKPPITVAVPRRYQVSYFWNALRSLATGDASREASLQTKINQFLVKSQDNNHLEKWNGVTKYEAKQPILVWRWRSKVCKDGKIDRHLEAFVPLKSVLIHSEEKTYACTWA